MSLRQNYAVEADGTVSHDLDPRVRAILERMARCAYMIDQHRQGIAINSQRIAELRAELERLEARR